jgi:nucleotide-binding universal stress UspA family protein
MRIVVGVDGSKASQTALGLVTRTAWPAGTQIRLVTACELPVDWSVMALTSGAGTAEEAEHDTLDSLHRLSEPLRQNGYPTETVVVQGRPADVLLAEADELGADLVVVGSRGLGVTASVLLGSVSAALVDHAPCPVLVARGEAVTRILLATDGSQSAEAIPAVLLAWKVFRDAPIDVLSVKRPTSLGDETALVAGLMGGGTWTSDASHEVDRYRVLANEMAGRLRAGGWHADGRVRDGEAAQEIEAAAAEWGADLIITGSRGLSGLRRVLLGSVAHHVLLHSRSSVLVMRGHVPARKTREVRLPSAVNA